MTDVVYRVAIYCGDRLTWAVLSLARDRYLCLDCGAEVRVIA